MKMGNHEVSNAELSRQIDEIFDVVSGFTNPDGTAKEVCDDNGKPFITKDGIYIPNNEYDLEGCHYETDDNGTIYRANGEYYPNDWFVVNGEFFQTDENGAIIQDSSESTKSEFVRHEPRTTTLSDGTVIEIPDPAMYSAPESSETTDVYNEEELIDLIVIDCPEGYLELTNAIDRINEDRSPDEPEVTLDYKVLEKDELDNPVLVSAAFFDGDTNCQYIFACTSNKNENASGKLFKHLYDNYGIGLCDIASVTEWDYRPEHAIITSSPNEESVWVLAHTIDPTFPKDFAYACMDWVKQEDGSWKFGYEFPIQQEYDSNFAEDALLCYLSDTLGWELGSDVESDDEDVADTQETQKKGGSYSDVRVEGEGDKYEVHHMPADSASPLERDDGPAIKMEKEDHRQTASCGMSREAREYREQQRELIEQGKFREALQMDIDDIHEKFGDKYDDAIAELLEYVDQLEQEGKI